MRQKTVYVIGLMSGTSLDGVDVAYVRFDKTHTYTYEILKAHTYPYNQAWQKKLKDAFYKNKKQVSLLDRTYGIFLGKLILDFIKENAIKRIDLIASHGHTIFHKPGEGYTLQIGDGQEIANLTGHSVVCDFRTQDVKLGGQGAPLVPIGDAILFSDYDYCVNIGGFSNVSFDENEIRKAFDICPANIVLNHYTRSIDLEFDDKGKIAQKGNLSVDLLEALNNMDLYKHRYSMGNETVTSTVIPLIDSFSLTIEDILRTYTEHIAIKIGGILTENTQTLLTGGGVYNDFLISRINNYTDSNLIIPDKSLIDYKEALVFAFLGLLRINNEINILSSVTGAEKNHSSGVLYTSKTIKAH